MSLQNSNRHDAHKYWVMDNGVRSAVNGSISWTSRFIAISLGADADHYATGHQDLNFPAVGTEIPIQDTVNDPSTPSTRAITVTGIQLNNWESLCYQRVPGDNFSTVDAKFYITNVYNHHFHSNESTIVVASRSPNRIKWLDGIITDINGVVEGTPPEADFWRQGLPNNLTEFPEGNQTDETMTIRRRGKVGIGDSFGATAWDPVAMLDVANGTRTGTDGRTATTPLYVTGNMSGVGVAAADPTNSVEFRHSNQTQGLGISFNGIFATGSNANQELVLRSRGTGDHTKVWPASASSNDEYYQVVARADGNLFNHQYFQGGSTQAQFIVQTDTASPWNSAFQFNIRTNNGYVEALRVQPDLAQVGNTTLYVGENRTNNRKIVMWGDGTSAHQFYGFGVNASTLRYQSSNHHRFYSATSATTSDEVMTILNTGRVGVNSVSTPNTNLEVNGGGVFGTPAVIGTRNASLSQGFLHAGGTTQVTAAIQTPQPVFRMFREGIAGVSWASSAEFCMDKHTAGINSSSHLFLRMGNGGTNQPNTDIMSWKSNGRIRIHNIPVFQNNNQATTGGLEVGELYRNNGGNLRIRF